MNKFYLFIAFLFVSAIAFGQYSGSAPITLQTPSGVSSIQWYKDGVALSGQTATSYTTSTAGVYYASFTDASTACTDDRTTFFVLLNNGSTVTLNGATNNGGGSSYQWKNGSSNAIGTGATTNTYTTSEGGLYRLDYNNGSCVVSSTDYYVFSLNAPCSAGSAAPILIRD